MRSKILRWTAPALVAGFLCVASVQAQGLEPRFKIPFPFQVQEKVLPAGEYYVSQMKGHPATVSFYSSDGKSHAFASTFSYSAKDDAVRPAKLVFNRYGEEKYFLSRYLPPYRTAGRQVVMSESERAMVQTWWKIDQVTLLQLPERNGNSSK